MNNFEKNLHIFLLAFGNTMLVGATLANQGTYELAFIGLSAFLISIVYRLGGILDTQLIKAKPYLFAFCIWLITTPIRVHAKYLLFVKRRRAAKMHKEIQKQLEAFEQLEEVLEAEFYEEHERSIIDVASTPFWYTLLAVEVMILVFFAVSFVRFFNENHGFTMFYFWEGLS